MEGVLEFIESGDLFSLLVLLILLCSIGSRMIERQPQLRQWGMRLAVVALLGYCIYAGSELGTSEPGPWVGIIFRGLLAAGITLGLSWIVLAVYGFMKQASDRAAISARVRAEQQRYERERQEAERERQRQELEWERGEPERERQRQLEELRRRENESQSEAAQQLRDDIRYSCELFFNRHAPAIGDRFTRRDLKLFFKQYMNDQQPPDVVRKRANQLLDTIREHVEAVNPPEKITSLKDLAEWYAQQKADIDEIDMDEEIKQDHLTTLNGRFAELSQQLMESIEP